MDESTRKLVRARARGTCEYCHLPEAHVITPFHIEHIIAKQHRGKDSTLCFSCLRCNLHKGPNLTGIDPVTSKITPLFNPRRHRWHKHFRWRDTMLIGKTAIGRTTIVVLAINDSARIRLRKELMDQGLFPS